uniref:sensor histidine kinase n=1 Tax=Sphingomonas bacterium TaxID=1895847 RepID=UPI002637366E
MSSKGGDSGWLASPWPWLAYLPFYCVPWLWQRPSVAQLIAFAAALLLFLPVYLLSDRLRGARLMAASAVVLGIGIALARWGGSWTVFPIYAAAMAGTARPPRMAITAIWCCAMVTAAVGLIHGQPLLWWVPGVMLVVMTGLGTVSRKNLHEHNRALGEAQDEVRRLSRTAERERIARDLHDLVGRSLTLVALKSDVAARLVASDPVRAEQEMRGVAEVAREGLAEVRASLAGMAG